MQSEKLKWQLEYVNYHSKNPFVAPEDSYQRTEIRLILEELWIRPNIAEFCRGNERVISSINILSNFLG